MQELRPVAELLAELADFAERTEQVLLQSAVDWHCCPDDEEWSLTEVACHLRDVEREVHLPRFYALMKDEEAFLPGAVADEWVQERRYRKQQGPTALKMFLEARRETLELLSKFTPAMWQRQGQHAFFGPTSMHELLNLVVQHDRAHWDQIQKLLAL